MDPGWRIANNAEVDAVVARWTRERTSAAALEALNARDIPCSPVRSAADVAAWPQLGAREMLQAVRHPHLPDQDGPLAPAFPLKFGAAATSYASPAPLHGQHNDEIFGRLLGLTSDEMSGLADRGVI